MSQLELSLVPTSNLCTELLARCNAGIILLLRQNAERPGSTTMINRMAGDPYTLLGIMHDALARQELLLSLNQAALPQSAEDFQNEG